MSEPRPIDPTERAHLRDHEGYSPPIYRFAPSAELREVVRRYWVPVWALPAGRETVQRVLQYPVVMLVIGPAYARCVGPSTGLSTQRLSGSGWALGVMCQPATGTLLTGADVAELTDAHRELVDLTGIDGGALVAGVLAEMSDAPADPTAQRRAIAHVEAAMRELPALDEEDRLVNALVETVETDASLHRVGQLAERFGLSERTLQRLCSRRIGLSPKWLIQRRRLHEAAERLRTADRPELATVAAELGYADQAHFTRDFKTVTGLTPGEYAAEPQREG